MPDFARPEYAPYIALCMELNLEHPDFHYSSGHQYMLRTAKRGSRTLDTFRARRLGDTTGIEYDEWQGPLWSYALTGASFVVGELDHLDQHVWLPSLSDWLTQLEARPLTDVAFVQDGAEWTCVWVDELKEDEDGFTRLPERSSWMASGATREEAAARLWMEVMAHRPRP